MKKPFLKSIHIAISILALAACFTCFTAENCYAEDERVTVNIEIGQNHLELANKMAENPVEWLSPFLLNEDAEGEYVADNVTQSGSKISITLPAELYLPRGESVLSLLHSSMGTAMQLYSSEDSVGAYYLNNGEMIRLRNLDSSPKVQTSIGLKPIENYEDYYDFKQDMESRGVYDAAFKEDVTYYLLWRKPLDSLDFQIEVPQCGEMVALDNAFTIPDNQPIVTCPEHTLLYTLGNSSTSEKAHAYWTTDFTIRYGFAGDLFEGTMTGGNKYLAAAYIGAEWGYFFAQDTEVTVNGEEAEKESRRSSFWLEEYELYKYIEVEHDFDDEWVVKKEPTCSTEGIEVCYCTGCGAEDTDTIEVDPDAHEWGDWKVTKWRCQEKCSL